MLISDNTGSTSQDASAAFCSGFIGVQEMFSPFTIRAYYSLVEVSGDEDFLIEYSYRVAGRRVLQGSRLSCDVRLQDRADI
jgi:hypothetical protein